MAPPPRSAVTAESKIFGISRDNFFVSALLGNLLGGVLADKSQGGGARKIAQELGSVQRFGGRRRLSSNRCQGWRDRAGTATQVEGRRNAEKLRGGGNARKPRFVNLEAYLEANLEMARGKSDPAPKRRLLL